MLILETVVRFRRKSADCESIKAIARDLRLSREVVRKAIRASEAGIAYQRTVQPQEPPTPPPPALGEARGVGRGSLLSTTGTTAASANKGVPIARRKGVPVRRLFTPIAAAEGLVLGVPLPVALAGTLLRRGFILWLPLLSGFLLIHRSLRRPRKRHAQQ